MPVANATENTKKPIKIRELKISESNVLSACLSHLGYLGIFHWRNNTGAVPGEYKGKKRLVRYGRKGMPDIMACINGRMVGIEVKSPTGKQSEDQKKFEDEMTAAKGTYCLVRSLDQLEAFLKTL